MHRPMLRFRISPRFRHVLHGLFIAAQSHKSSAVAPIRTKTQVPPWVWQGGCDRLAPSLMKGGASTMDETTFQNKLAELMGEISTLPKAERDKLTDLAQKTQARHEKLKKTVNDLQESLDYLRLSIKYLVFDLEATRRENSYLRKMLESDRSSGNGETH
jgi:hypothetical protein